MLLGIFFLSSKAEIPRIADVSYIYLYNFPIQMIDTSICYTYRTVQEMRGREFIQRSTST